MGYTLKTMACALWAYYHAPDFKTGLVTIVNQGGDADTNACVAGAVLGAKFGYNNIPALYVNNLLQKEILEDRFTKYLHII